MRHRRRARFQSSRVRAAVNQPAGLPPTVRGLPIQHGLTEERLASRKTKAPGMTLAEAFMVVCRGLRALNNPRTGTPCSECGQKTRSGYCPECGVEL